EGEDVDLGERTRERLRARVVRAVADADDERALVQPERVSALRQGRWLEPGRDGDSRTLEVACHRVDLSPPPLLAGAEEDGSALSDDRGVVDVHGVRVSFDRIGDDDLRTGGLELAAE